MFRARSGAGILEIVSNSLIQAGLGHAVRKCASVATMLGASAAFLMGFSVTETQNAVANGDTRTIYLYHAHSKESISATFRVDGQYNGKVLEQLNWFLRDWRLDEPTKMDPRLFDLIWETYRESGSREPIQVQSAYRSPQTNAMLRRRSKAVAENSQHMAGKAMDLHFMDVPRSRVREIGMRLQGGGVGYYPSAGSPFVHLDVGSVRAWPRMNYDQLARLFPDGKTVHIPSNGQPLARYEEARAEISARGGSYVPTLEQVRSPNFFAWLFGGGEDEDVAAAPRARPAPRGRTQVASLGRATGIGPAPQSSSYAPVATGPGEDSSAAFFMAEANRNAPQPQSPVVARAQGNLPRGETYIGPAASQPVVVASAQPVQAGLAPVTPQSQLRAPDATDLQTRFVRTVDMPLPPKRPADLPMLMASLAPLPPVRPPEFSALPPPPKATAAPARADAIAGLIGSFNPTPQPAPRPRALPAIITQGTSVQASAPRAMSYAPEQPPFGRSVVQAKSTVIAPPASAAAAAKAPAAKKTDLVPARLDRSNFRSLTAPGAIARMPTQNALSSAVAALRPAARVDARALVFSAEAAAPARFEPWKPTATLDRFSGSALETPFASNDLTPPASVPN